MTDPPVLLAEDYRPDVVATRRAWSKARIANPLHVVGDGEQCLDYLYQRGAYGPASAPQPGLLLLDVKMPRLSGLEVLAHLRSRRRFDGLPVVMLTGSSEEPDVRQSYRLGANAYIVKPVSLDRLYEAAVAMDLFWSLVRRPK
jgi:two-component system response regulator